MAIQVESHNILHGFSDPLRIPDLLDAVENRTPDVIFYSEAYDANEKQYVGDVINDLGQLGYVSEAVDYKDADDRTDTHGLLLAVKSRLVTADQLPQPLRLASRNAVRAMLYDKSASTPIHGYFSHFDDRSSTCRGAMVTALADYLPDPEANRPMLLAGDLNSADRADGGMAAKLRVVSHLRPLMRPLYRDPESIAPDTSTLWKKLIRANSLAYRASDMANDRILDYLAALGFTETDPGNEPTKSGLRLDHILQANMHVLDAGVLPANELSDHRAVYATLEN